MKYNCKIYNSCTSTDVSANDVPTNIETTRKYYATNEELIQDLGVAYQDVIKQFYEAGCRNLQLDDCTWGAIVGDAAKQRYKALGIDLEDLFVGALRAVAPILVFVLVIASLANSKSNGAKICVSLSSFIW